MNFATANSNAFDATKRKATCLYVNGRWETTRNFIVQLRYSDSSIFNKLVQESSSWNDEGNCFVKNNTEEVPLEPKACPFVQAPGISIVDDTPIKLFYPNPNAYFEPNFIANKWLSYQQLFNYCGATSTCIIDIGQCDKENENCDAYGAVYLDISAKDVVKISKIYSYKVSGNTYTFKQKQPVIHSLVQISGF